jgi:hypothetical protein
MAESANKEVLKSTNEGKIYIETEDFFELENVQDLITKMKHSTIFKSIQQRRRANKPGEPAYVSTATQD